ncbi:hypothetical protein C2S52_001587 [Perilla frutescens var. hirtella]|nr:hypothetical protein C2S52_001587 [Perilla frutescens var. hirtella]
METRFTRPDRNKDVIQPSSCKLSIFSGQVRVFGGQINHKLPYALRKKAHWYILNNCKEVEVYKKEHLQILSTKVAPDLIFQYHELEFPQWFKEKIVRLRALNHEEATNELYALALEPDAEVQLFDACVVNGIRYHTKSHDARRSSQNSGRGGYWKVVEKVQYRGIFEVMEKEDENDELSLSENRYWTTTCRFANYTRAYANGVVNKKIELLLLRNKADKVAADTKDFIQRGTEVVYERMVQLREEYKEKQLETGSKPLIDLEISSLVCDEVLGVRPRYIRGMGHGPKPATWMFYDASSNKPTNEELKNELQATQDALKCVRAEQEMMREAFEKIFAGVLQSMFRQLSPRTPSHYPPTTI